MSWWDSDWQYRKVITIDHTKVTGSHSNYRFLVKWSTDSDLSSHAQADGDDIVFIDDDDSTQLDHEIVHFDNSDGELVAWVLVPDDVNATTDRDIYMYFGNSGVTNSEDAAGVWSGFSGIWHDALTDVSGQGNTGSATGTTTGTGKLHTARFFDGVDDQVEITDAAELDVGNNEDFSWTYWFRKATNTFSEGEYGAVVKKLPGSPGSGYQVYMAQDSGWMDEGDIAMEIYVSGTWDGEEDKPASWDDDAWHKLVFVRDVSSAELRLYVDGNLRVTEGSTLTGDLSNSVNLFFGGVSTTGFTEIDLEHLTLEIGSFPSANLISTEYANQNSPGTFFSVGDLIAHVDSSKHVHTSDNVTVVVKPGESIHSHTSDRVNVTASVESSTHLHTSETAKVVNKVVSSKHLHTSEKVQVTANVGSSTHTHKSDQVKVTAQVQSSTHTHISDQVRDISLVNSSTHRQTSENVQVTAKVESSTHAHTSIEVKDITRVEDSRHVHKSEEVKVSIDVEDSKHLHTSDKVLATTQVESSIHKHTSDNVKFFATVQSSVHKHTSSKVTIFIKLHGDAIAEIQPNVTSVSVLPAMNSVELQESETAVNVYESNNQVELEGSDTSVLIQ